MKHRKRWIHDALVDPTDLLDLREPCKEVFSGKAWSSDSVYAQTIEDLRQLGRTYHTLPTLIDIDTAEDLKSVEIPGVAR
ncbi:MAG: hypothetical protein WBG34_15530 [Flavobacteriales bacterium]